MRNYHLYSFIMLIHSICLNSPQFRFIYTNNFSMKRNNGIDFLDQLVAADDLQVSTLISYIQDKIIQNQQTWLKDNLMRIWQSLADRPSCEMLYNHAQSIIASK